MAGLPPITFLLQDVPALYGAERVTLALMAGLQARGLDLHVLLIGESRLGRDPAAMARAVVEAGLPMQRLEVAGPFSGALLRTVRRQLKARPGSILHTVGYKAHLHALLASRGLASSVTTIHGWLVRPELKERIYEGLEVQALRHDEAVICLTSYYENLLVQRGVPRERLHRIPSGLENLPTPEQAAVQPVGPFTVALVGRLSSEKNHDLLLRAVARLRAAGLVLRVLLAGEGPERPHLEEQIQRLGLSDTVEFVGYVSMPDLLPRLHAVVLCSRIENMPLSLMEAMAWGRPVVATRVGGVPDIVQDQVTGFLISPDDEDGLVEKLRQLADSPELRRRLGQAARQRVEEQFLLSVCLDRHVALYRQLADVGSPS